MCGRNRDLGCDRYALSDEPVLHHSMWRAEHAENSLPHWQQRLRPVRRRTVSDGNVRTSVYVHAGVVLRGTVPDLVDDGHARRSKGMEVYDTRWRWFD